MKKYHISFNMKHVEDRLLLEASLKALNSEVLAARYGHTVIHDDSTEITKLEWWKLQTGGFNEK